MALEKPPPSTSRPNRASPDEGSKADKLVVFEEGDPANPRTWSRRKRWSITLFSALLIVVNTWCSSAPTGAREAIIARFGVSDEVFNLVLSLYLLGYVTGPFLWAPLSESYGRRPVFIASGFFFACFNAGCTASDSFASLLICRFLSAALGCAPMTNAGSMLGDVWTGTDLGFAVLFYSIGPWAGPSFGPLAGGYLARYGWRWIFICQTIVATVMLLISSFLLPETYAPRILQKRARRLRKETGDDTWLSALDVKRRNETNLRDRIAATLATPFKMLFTEVTVILVTVYMCLAYGIVYALFESYPIIFTELRGLSPGRTGIAFLPVFAGCLLSIPISYWSNRAYARAAREAKECGKRPAPELRLHSARIGGPLTVVALLWLGWTGYKPEIIWVVPALSGIPLGLGCTMIFRALQTYLVEFYGTLSASALAATVSTRSLFGASIPLYATQMNTGLGVEWAQTLLALLTLVLVPLPWLFASYGDRIRKTSRYAYAS